MWKRRILTRIWTKAAPWIGRGVPVNYLFWWPATFFVGYVHYLFLSEIEGIAGRRAEWIWAAGMVHSMMLICALVWVEGMVEESRWSWLRYGWGAGLGMLLLAFPTDLALFKTMGIHLPTGLRLLTENGWEHFWVALEATGIRENQARQFCVAMLAAGLAGIAVTRLTWRLSRAAEIRVSAAMLPLAICGVLIIVSAWEWGWRRDNPKAKAWEEVHRVMPFSIRLFELRSGEPVRIGALPLLPGPTEIAERIERIHPPDGELPDMVLIIVESLRGDYLDERATPCLKELEKDCLAFGDSLAAANATHLSWFSLFMARQPLYFRMVARDRLLWGSIPLKLLKKAGYEIVVLAGTSLNYHRMDQIIFGPDRRLADSFVDSRNLEARERPARDQAVTSELIKRIGEKPGGRIFLIFYDSSHHDYYWPDDFELEFLPVIERWNYFDFNIDGDKLERIKNRYRNSVKFIDGLVGSVVRHLKEAGRYEKTLLFVTGDHGEEFLEHGKLVHASNLWREQIHVPFLLKLPEKWKPSPTGIALDQLTATHLDLFPTILDGLGVNGFALMGGESLFRKKENIVLSADDNGARDPYRFCLISGDLKGWFEYRSDSTLIALERKIYLKKVTDQKDQPVRISQGTEEFRAALGTIFRAGPVQQLRTRSPVE